MKTKAVFVNEKFLLAAILAVSVFLRLLPFGNTLLYFDSYHHLSTLREFLKDPSVPMFSSLSKPPEGAWITEPFGFFLLPIILSPIIGPFQAVGIATVIFGFLMVLAAFLLSKELFGAKAGLLTAFIVGVLPATVSRSLWGDFRGDSMAAAFWLLSFYFLFRGHREKNSLYLIISGILISLSSLFWLGGFFGVVLFFSYFFVIFLKNFYRGEKSQIYLPMFLPVIILPYIFRLFTMVPDPFLWFLSGWLPLPVFMFAGLVALKFLLDFALVRIKAKKKARIIIVSAMLVLSAASVFLLNPMPPDQEMIAELHRPDFNFYWLNYTIIMLGAALPLGILGIWYMRKPEEKNMFILLFILIGLFAFANGRRFIFLLSIPISISAAIPASAYISRSKRYAFGRLKVPTAIPFAATLILLGYLLISGYQFSSGSFPRPGEDMVDAMMWLKENTPEDAIIMTYWDRGGFVQGLAERKSWVDGTEGQNSYRIEDMADFYLSENSTPVIDNADYMVLDLYDVMEKNKWRAVLVKGGWSFENSEFTILENMGGFYASDDLSLRTVQLGNDIHCILDTGKERLFARITSIEVSSVNRTHYITRRLNVKSINVSGEMIEVGNFGALLFSNHAVLVQPGILDTMYVKLNVLPQPVKRMEMVYSNGYVKIYKITK